jgi:hypothetical protein
MTVLDRTMCNDCGDETIYHVEGERPFGREHCFCRCHDRLEGEHMISGVSRDDQIAAASACERCRWAHVVAYSTVNWRNDERYMQPPTPAPARPEA